MLYLLYLTPEVAVPVQSHSLSELGALLPLVTVPHNICCALVGTSVRNVNRVIFGVDVLPAGVLKAKFHVSEQKETKLPVKGL